MIEKTLTPTRNAEGICATRGVELIGSARSGGPQLAIGLFTATGTSNGLTDSYSVRSF
jgi:hypothetical protein